MPKYVVTTQTIVITRYVEIEAKSPKQAEKFVDNGGLSLDYNNMGVEYHDECVVDIEEMKDDVV